LILVPILGRCLMLSGEAEAVTGISTSRRIMVRPIRKPFQGLAMRGNFSGRFAAGDGPRVRRAHHNALKHRLAADQSLLAALKRGEQLHSHKETPPCSQKTHVY